MATKLILRQGEQYETNFQPRGANNSFKYYFLLINDYVYKKRFRK